ncbi:hypothetical protein [Methylobacterium haplocladii]|uniref:Flagellar protein FlaG n=1 Tax=Methylobacterium haplocladii TaxID=1176176 RepID=A0A512INB2_9HYPH|nr:hypothetical protein [Methylobacterium haplocladii]GEO99193.1 hypothetical protein MHA02_15810 [Methylobacterium haplocladii]GJD83163.1 hypothetical protein HPGCJGGD_1026 [Methylobacterium haplocladii]GLS59103.1 hypothetical protein GCM10007887_17690 [Methylobacterium haplocladii]
MDPIRPVISLPPLAAIDPPPRVGDADRGSDERRLDPAVSLDISPNAGKSQRAETERRGFERDLDSQALVYRITDSISGDVIVQIPNEIVIKARVYGREQNPPVTGERVEKRA